MAQKVISLNTSEKYPSLNLSHAVAIVLHDLSCINQNNIKKETIKTYEPSSAKEYNDFPSLYKVSLIDLILLILSSLKNLLLLFPYYLCSYAF